MPTISLPVLCYLKLLAPAFVMTKGCFIYMFPITTYDLTYLNFYDLFTYF